MKIKKCGITIVTAVALLLQIAGTNEVSAAQNGWQTIDGIEYYYENGEIVKSKWINQSYVDENGKKVMNQLIYDANYQSFFFLKEDGTYADKQWINWNQHWYYFKSGGYMVRNQWQGNYYLKDNGEMAINELIYDEKYKSSFYLKADGSYANNQWQKINSKWYAFGSDGSMLTKHWKGNYYLKSNGQMAEMEWIYDEKYKSYFYLKEDGTYADNEWLTIDGKRYSFKSGGYMMHKQWNGNHYLKSSGAMAQNEWIYDDVYKAYFYLKADGTYVNNQWLQLEGKWYSFKPGGYMRQNEWLGKYYFSSTGAMIEDGTITIDNMKYTFAKNGELIASEVVNKGWVKVDGKRYFYNNLGERIGNENAKKVIDVSEHNGKIDWETVIRENEIDGVIVRLGFSVSSTDKMLEYNIKELHRLNIPYGVYLYSYAENEDDGKFEAQHTMNLIKRYNINPTYPIYYDVENWEYVNKTKRAPQDQATWVKIINKYMQTMHDAGYNNVRVYSYRYLLQTRLNHPDILKYVDWVAAYQDSLGYENPYYSGPKGWQYTSNGTLKGHAGRFDMNVWY